MPPFGATPVEDDVTPADLFGGSTPPPDQTPKEDTPPNRGKRNRATSAATEKVKRVSTLTNAKIELGAAKLFSRIGATGYLYGASKNNETMMFDAAVVAENSDDLGKAVAAACDRSPKLRKSIERLSSASEYSALGAVVISVALPIAVNHNLIPFGNLLSQWLPQPASAPAMSEVDRAAFEEVLRMAQNDPAMQGNPVPRQSDNGARSADLLV